MKITDRVDRLRHHNRCHNHREFEIELRELAEEVERLEREIGACRASVPARVTVTNLEGNMGNTYPQGTNPKFAAAVANAEGVALPGAPVTWSATNGTLVTPDPANPDVVELTNAQLGDATVTATTENGVSGSDTVTIVDNTPATVTVTDSAA